MIGREPLFRSLAEAVFIGLPGLVLLRLWAAAMAEQLKPGVK